MMRLTLREALDLSAAVHLKLLQALQLPEAFRGTKFSNTDITANSEIVRSPNSGVTLVAHTFW